MNPQTLFHAGRTIRLLDLARHTALFRDEKAFLSFLSLLATRLAEGGTTILTCGESAIGVVQPGADAREAFQRRIAAQLAESPNLLTELAELAADGEFVLADRVEPVADERAIRKS